MSAKRITPVLPASILMLFLLLGTVYCRKFTGDPFESMYKTNCSSCHGEDLRGTAIGPSLIDTAFLHGESNAEVIQSIKKGFPTKGMPSFEMVLSETDIQKVAIFINEQRSDYDIGDFKVRGSMELPSQTIQTEEYAFQIKEIAQGLDPWPYSIQPLPDGRLLLTEKTKGLRIISADGTPSEYIRGTPKAYDDSDLSGLHLLRGKGWILDVALHPDYAQNGWIYLSFGDRCTDCDKRWRIFGKDVSMLQLVRGRIRDGEWVDQETIWQADPKSYTPAPDITLGGRICFDKKGYVFFSSGGKEYRAYPPGNIEMYLGIQDLSIPYGKIHRVYDDGRIPEDNPFTSTPNAVPSIWTYGHRSPQGLEIDPGTGLLWGTEMGPRGGDEVNLLLPGRNYGWPLTSKGVNYDGSKVEFGKYLDIEFAMADIEQPKVDLTPSPAISSFIFYTGDAFPEWKGNMIVGSLKATALYRMVIKNNEVVHQEILVSNLARIRDVEQGPNGEIYLLLEHASGGRIVQLEGSADN